MLTDKVRELKENASKPFPTTNESSEIIDELIDNCMPTESEFDEITFSLTVTGGSLYRLIMDAPCKWGLGESCVKGND